MPAIKRHGVSCCIMISPHEWIEYHALAGGDYFLSTLTVTSVPSV